jgi:hypothetical protein
MKCNCPANFEYTAVHRGFTGNGVLLVNIAHHGDHEGVAINFAEMDKDPERRIEAFASPSIEGPKPHLLISNTSDVIEA